MGITTFDVYATKLLGKITPLCVDGIFSSIVLLTYRKDERKLIYGNDN